MTDEPILPDDGMIASDTGMRARNMWEMPDNNKPLWRGKSSTVPRAIAICPECQGTLAARSLEWDAASGRPEASAIELDCEHDCRGGKTHRHFQSDWQPVRDAIAKWCKASNFTGVRRTEKVSVIYWAAPKEGFTLTVHEHLHVRVSKRHGQIVATFYRGINDLNHVGYCEGDCAIALARAEVSKVQVIEVGQLSGFARLREVK